MSGVTRDEAAGLLDGVSAVDWNVAFRSVGMTGQQVDSIRGTDDDGCTDVVVAWFSDDHGSPTEADARIMAAAPRLAQAVVELTAEVERLRARLLDQFIPPDSPADIAAREERRAVLAELRERAAELETKGNPMHAIGGDIDAVLGDLGRRPRAPEDTPPVDVRDLYREIEAGKRAVEVEHAKVLDLAVANKTLRKTLLETTQDLQAARHMANDEDRVRITRREELAGRLRESLLLVLELDDNATDDMIVDEVQGLLGHQRRANTTLDDLTKAESERNAARMQLRAALELIYTIGPEVVR